jgi:hypothetical protein
MASIAILSNPESDGNKSRLERLRDYCAAHSDILHIEVERTEDVGLVLNRIAMAKPAVIVVNGGDGTVQSVLTELFGEGSPDRPLPPIAVLPSGKTNLIAKDLSSVGDPIRALERVLTLAREGVGDNIVSRQLISLDDGSGGRPVLGMFLAAGALTDILLFCRHKLYPLGLPNGIAHALTVIAGLASVITDWSSRFLPPKPRAIGLQVGEHRMRGRFQVLMVTTLRRLVLSGKAPAEREGTLQLLAIERRRRTALRTVYETLLGRLGKKPIKGVHLRMGDHIRIEDDQSGVIMDGEFFMAAPGKPIILRPTQSVRFLDLGRGARAPEAFADLSPLPTPRAGALLSDAR